MKLYTYYRSQASFRVRIALNLKGISREDSLPTGDHPTEQLAFRGDGWIYWSQGSTTNSGVVGLDNGGGHNQSDIPCQDITLSQNVFSSGNGQLTSGYSPFNTQNPGGTIPAFFNSFTGQVRQGVCDGAIFGRS